MAIQKSQGPIDTSGIEAELAEARGQRKPTGGGQKSGGKSVKDIVVEQSKLPHGIVTFQVLPNTEELPTPWVRWEEHFFFHDGTRKWAKGNCQWKMTNGAEQCAGCDFIQKINRAIIWKLEKMNDMEKSAYFQANPSHRGVEKLIKKGGRKQHIALNVKFTSWLGGPVPEEFSGARVLKVGAGIWKGTAKNQVGGLLALLEKTPDMAEPTNALEISLNKISEDEHGKSLELDTTYIIQAVTTPKTVLVDGESTVIDVKVRKAIASTPEGIKALLDGRGGLGVFLRMKTRDEFEKDLAEIDTYDVQSEAPRGGNPPASAPRTAQRDLQKAQEAFNHGPGDDDCPF